MCIVRLCCARAGVCVCACALSPSPRYPGYGGSTEGRTAAELLEVYDKRAPEELAVLAKKQVFNFLDNEVGTA